MQKDNTRIPTALQSLQDVPRWVSYSGAPLDGGKIDKAPLSPRTGRAAKNDQPATWGTHRAAQKRADAMAQPGHAPGVGVQMGDLGDGTALCGVDLDGCLADALEPWARAICDRLKTYAEVSPSGSGVKLFFRVKAEDLPTIRAAMGRDHRRVWKAGEHHGAELHLSNSYFTVTGRAYGTRGEALRTVPVADLLWLVREAGPAVMRAPNGSPRGSTRDTSGSGQGYSLLLDLFRAGSTEEEARADIERDDGAAGEWWARTDGRQRDRAVARALAEFRKDRARLVARLDSCWSDDELDDMQAAALLGFDDPPAGALAVADDDFGAPMMRGDKPVHNMHNAILYLGRNLDSILPDLRCNQMTGRNEWRGGDVDDATLTLARVKLERRGLETIGKDLVADAVAAVARYHTYHPIRGDLARVIWDGSPRLDSWLVRLAGAEDSPYVRAVGRKFLIQMVARVMRPGCKADHVLVLSGAQGIGKSTACRVLAGDDYFSDSMPRIGGLGQEAEKHLMGKWVIEIGEMASLRKSEAEDMKAFITGQTDKLRRPYDRLDAAFPRQCVFIATTNDDEFLRDDTGGRRFWPVTVPGVIDTDALAAERDQLLAEALAAFTAGESWWFDRDFEARHAKPMQDAARVADTWGEIVTAWLDKPVQDFGDGGDLRREVTIPDVLGGALGIPPAQQTMAAQKRAAAIMRGIGWVKVKSHGRMVWRRPEA